MASPSTTLATLRPDLAGSLLEFDLAMDAMGFIAHRVLPVHNVGSASGPYGKIPLEQLLQNPDTKRAPGSGYQRGQFTFTTDSFACQEHGWEEPVDDRNKALYASYFDHELISTRRAYDAVLRNAEKRAAALLFNASTFTSQTTNVTHEWDDATNAVPIDNINTAVLAIYNRTGVWPNALIINRKVFRNLIRCDQIVDQSKSQGFMDVRPGKINETQLAAALNIERIIVADTAKNTADVGASASISPIWSDEYAMVARVSDDMDPLTPCVGRTFHYTGDGSSVDGTVETYRDETVRSDIVRVRHDVDEKITYLETAQLLDNVTTI